MATREELYAALKNADAAGDVASAKRLAAYIQSMPQESAPAEKPKPPGSVSDAPNAVATGFNQGLLRLGGLPVDTIANVVDLGKAGAGYISSKFNNGQVPEMFMPTDRRTVVGSGEYLIDKAKASAANALVTAQNPEYEGGYLQAAGGGLNAIINPNSRAQAINQGVIGVTSALAGKGAQEATGNTAVGITASMLPLLAQRGVVAGTKRLVRGGEAGRQEMAQRIQDLKAAGVDDPTLGLASGNSAIGGMENLLQNAPGAVGVMRTSRENVLNALQKKVEGAAAMASGNRGTLEAGRSIQSGIKGFKEDFKTRQGALYDKLDEHISQRTPTDVGNTRNALASLNEDIPGAPNLSPLFKNGRIQGIQRALEADVAQKLPSTPSQLKAALAKGATNADELSLALGEGRLPYQAVKKTRTLVGNEIADNSLMSDVPRSKWNPLYGALSEDMRGAAAAAGPGATNAFNRANEYTRTGINRLERVAPFANKDAPEQAFTALERSANENVSTLQAVKKTLPPGARGDVAGTIIERLGLSTPGKQNESGTTWSPETFLTNWNRMAPQARKELLSGFPNADKVAADINAVAKVTSMMRDNSKIWANPSGTGANAAARGTLAAIGVGGAGALAGVVAPVVPLAAAGAVGSSNILARTLSNRNLMNALARPDTPNPQLTQAQINELVSSGLLEESQRR
jgi:hypothetical protein